MQEFKSRRNTSESKYKVSHTTSYSFSFQERTNNYHIPDLFKRRMSKTENDKKSEFPMRFSVQSCNLAMVCRKLDTAQMICERLLAVTLGAMHVEI